MKGTQGDRVYCILLKDFYKRVCMITKGWFPYDRYDRWKKRPAIVAIMWKPLFSDGYEML